MYGKITPYLALQWPKKHFPLPLPPPLPPPLVKTSVIWLPTWENLPSIEQNHDAQKYSMFY